MNNSPWYTPGSYGGTTDWLSTPLVHDYIDPTVPRGVYQAYLTQQGLGGMDARSQFAQGQYNNSQTGYQAAARENPALAYSDYLKQQFGAGGLDTMWASLAPSQRGEQTTKWTGPNRTIAWG